MYLIKFTEDGLADVKALPKNVRNSLKKELLAKVAKDPEGCSEQLQGPLKDYRSFHFRRYRVVCRVFRDLGAVAIVGVGTHSTQARADVYRKLELLASRGKLAETMLLSMRGFIGHQE